MSEQSKFIIGEDELLTGAEVSIITKRRDVAHWPNRYRNGEDFPRPYKNGKGGPARVVYRRSEVQAWLDRVLFDEGE